MAVARVTYEALTDLSAAWLGTQMRMYCALLGKDYHEEAAKRIRFRAAHPEYRLAGPKGRLPH